MLALFVLLVGSASQTVDLALVDNEVFVHGKVEPGSLLLVDGVKEVEPKKICFGPFICTKPVYLNLKNNSKQIASGKKKWRSLIAIPMDAKSSEKIWIETSTGIYSRLITVEDKFFPVSVVRVDERFVSKKSRALKRRIRREAKEMQRVFETVFKISGFPKGKPIRPVPGVITSPFGARREYNGLLRSRHYGLDLDAKIGEPVYAALDGLVVFEGSRYFSGHTIVVAHGAGLATSYYHLSKSFIKKGARVRLGQKIGLAGKSGRVSGPHLHFGVNLAHSERDGTKSLSVDPEIFLNMSFD